LRHGVHLTAKGAEKLKIFFSAQYKQTPIKVGLHNATVKSDRRVQHVWC